MKLLRKHWFDLGLLLAGITAFLLAYQKVDTQSLEFLMWLQLIMLFLHQFEEYRFPGYFPGFFNTVLFKSKSPDRFPLNSQAALIINVIGGWGLYFLAAFFNERALWLCIAATLVSLGNFIVHTFLFNIKGRILYNPGMFTALFSFLPAIAYFIYYISDKQIVNINDYIFGVLLGIFANAGLILIINRLKNENSPYTFEQRQMIPKKQK